MPRLPGWIQTLLLLIAPLCVPGSGAGESAATENIVIVFDCSWSMRYNFQNTEGPGLKKMDAAKAALKEMVDKIPAATRVGLLVFGAALPDDWAFSLAPVKQEQLKAAIDKLTFNGGTPLGEYMKKGADRLLKARAEQRYGTYRLLIVTDGEADDLDLMNRYAGDILARGITVDVIGVGMRRQHTLATKVHSYRRADDPESLKQGLAAALAEVTQRAGKAGGDAGAANEFETVAPLPVEVASAMLRALASPSNSPIGEGAGPSPKR